MTFHTEYHIVALDFVENLAPEIKKIMKTIDGMPTSTFGGVNTLKKSSEMDELKLFSPDLTKCLTRKSAMDQKSSIYQFQNIQKQILQTG